MRIYNNRSYPDFFTIDQMYAFDIWFTKEIYLYKFEIKHDSVTSRIVDIQFYKDGIYRSSSHSYDTEVKLYISALSESAYDLVYRKEFEQIWDFLHRIP